VSETLNLTRFEQELIRHLRALPFETQQHVSRYILKLQREQRTVPTDERGPRRPGQTPDIVWNMTPDELEQIRQELRDEKQRDDE